ncbi:MAG: SUMF1/EgtB/PvdO family nonheme iron enzyme [Deltaproteobacteria bacterium]|nr:SUMF1/EgtB/PvdO family nonheme iron enzyme [Deltaproteobacteria bacterium]
MELRSVWSLLVAGAVACVAPGRDDGERAEAGLAAEEEPARVDAAIAADDEEPELPVPEPVAAATPQMCPPEMVLVEGRYCPDVVHICRRWVDPPGRFHDFRCAEYAPSVCKSRARKPLRFCIDRDEFTAPGELLPQVNHSWSSAKKACTAMGKRLCVESEWQFACEGEDMRPYPYGFVRDAGACNIDRGNIMGKKAPVDFREPAGSHARCVSPFGVRDMSGNIEEWATIDGVTAKGQRSTMKGAWWLPGRNHCRARTLGHGEIYFGPQIGVRCCKDVGR